MRILVASDQWFPDRMGGVARVATDTARGLAARGHDVVAIAPRHRNAPQQALDDGVALHRALPRGRIPQTLTDPGATRRAANAVADRAFDVLVAHSATTAEGLLASRLGCPLVYVFHADAAEEARYLRGHVRLGREWLSALVFERPLRTSTRRALRAAAAVIVLSEFSRQLVAHLDQSAARKVVLASGGVDTEVFTPSGREDARRALGIADETRLVFTARRLEPRMGLENLLSAVTLLADRPQLRVVIAGSGTGMNLHALCDRLGLGARVALIGPVTDDELAQWHRAADLFVLPTLAFEGFGLATAEALASGTPVVGTPVGATPELLEPIARELVARGTGPRDLADAIGNALELATPELRLRCREHALANFSWSTVLPLWERVLDEVSTHGGLVEETASSQLSVAGGS